MDILKLEHIFKDIWEHDNKEKKPIGPYENSFQKRAFWLMVITLAVGLLVALSTKICNTGWQKIIALLLVLISQIAAVVYQLSVIFQSFRFSQDLTYNFLEPLATRAAQDYQLAKGMIRFERDKLEYALARLRLEIAQMKSRVGVLVGAIETVGILPSAISIFISWHRYFADGNIKFQGIDWIMFPLGAFMV